MEDTASHSSCISRSASVSAGESSWAMHFAGFLASWAHSDREVDRQGGGGVSKSSSSSGFSSSFDSLGDDDDDFFITSDLMDDDDDEDDSLQDTACSSAAGTKVTSMNDICMESKVTMDAKGMDITQLAKYFLNAACLRQQATTADPAQEVISGGNGNEKQLYECNDLRKKGLCLVPLSMLIDYLGD